MSHTSDPTAGTPPGAPLPNADVPQDVLAILVAEDGAIVVVGDLDLAGGPVLEAAVDEAAKRGAAQASAADGGGDGTPPGVTLDLANVTFIDSSGLRSLLAANREALERGGVLRLRHPSAGVRRLLQITGTDEHFTIEDDR